MSNKSKKISIKGNEIVILQSNKEDYISITDIAKYKNSEATGLVISHWLSTKYTIEFMGFWKKCTTLILILRNSVTLKMKQDQMDLFFPVKIG